MKKLFLLGTFLLSVFGFATVNAQNCGEPCAPCDQPTGQCWCQYVHYEPCPYTIKRCVEEPYTCTRQCCRMVPQYYQVQRCRMVPEYYCETRCKYCPEYYCVEDCKTRTRVVCEPACEWVPRTYWKCENRCANPCAPSCCN